MREVRGSKEKRISLNIARDAVGLNLRPEYLAEVLSELPKISFLEIIAENSIADDALLLNELESIREHYPMALHCLGMSLGSISELDFQYLALIREISERLAVSWVSDHLAWTSVHGVHFHDLLPLPYTWETVEHVSSRIRQAQDLLNRQILIENISCYLNFKDSEMSEAEFVVAVAEQADCKILLDVSNIYVNCINQGLDSISFIKNIPQARVGEIHLGGFEPRAGYILDSHGAEIAEEVWKLYMFAIQYFGNVPTVIERDNNLPALHSLLKEVSRARSIMRKGDEMCGNA